MKCGNCEREHDSVAEVRACYGVKRPNYTKEGQDQSWRDLPPSDRQMELLRRLRDRTGEPARFTGEITRGQASDEIDELLGKSREVPAPKAKPGVDLRAYVDNEHKADRPRAHDWADVPDGWYATAGHANAEIDFWQVNAPTEGRWIGYIFVNRIIGGQSPQRIRWEEQAKALEAIRAAGPNEAMGLFGQKMGRCGKCGRHLTRKASRELGIGPDCANHLGMGETWKVLDQKYGGA